MKAFVVCRTKLVKFLCQGHPRLNLYQGEDVVCVHGSSCSLAGTHLVQVQAFSPATQ